MVARLAGLCLLILISFELIGAGYQHNEVDRLLVAGQDPDGVVFELMAWEDNTWDWASPMIAAFTRQLRQKYPGIDIAIVSHGAELFDLALNQNNAAQPAIKMLKTLSDQNIAIHVCGNYASFKGLGVDDFLPFVDVAPSGPAQLEDYIRLGFEHIVLKSTSSNSDFFATARKHSAENRSAENRSVYKIHEDRPGWRTSTVLTPQLRKKTTNRGVLEKPDDID